MFENNSKNNRMNNSSLKNSKPDLIIFQCFSHNKYGYQVQVSIYAKYSPLKTIITGIYRRLKSYLQLRLQVVYHKRYHLRPLLKNAYGQNDIINAYEL
jgi:hypothetical protein